MFTVTIKNNLWEDNSIVKDIEFLSDIKTNETNKKNSPVWMFSNGEAHGGFVVDIDKTTFNGINVVMNYEFYLHRTHNSKFRMIIPFDKPTVMSKAEFKTAYYNCVKKLGFLGLKTKNSQIDEKCISPVRWFYQRPSWHKLQHNSGERYRPTFTKDIKSTVLYVPKPLEYFPECKKMFDRVRSFYEYYRAKIDWSSIKTDRCELALHDSDVSKDIDFNDAGDVNGFKANIYCYHETCRSRLANDITTIFEEAGVEVTCYDYTVMYLYQLIKMGKLHIHQLELCVVDSRFKNYLPRLQYITCHAKKDAPLWMKVLHRELVRKNNINYEYRDGYYNALNRDEMVAFYNLHIGTYVGYISLSRIKTKPFIEEIMTYIDAEAYDNYKNVSEVEGLCLNNKIITLSDGKVYVHEHTPHYFFTNKRYFDYDENSKCEMWEKCLVDYFEHLNSPQVLILQEYFGYCLTYDTRFEKFLVMFGESRAGKNTIAETLVELLDGCQGEFKLFVDVKNRAFMEDKKVGFIDETLDCNTPGSVNQLKKLVSTGEMQIRKLYADAYSTLKKPKLVMAFNNPPDNLQIDKALKNRILALKFTKSFSGHENINLKSDLKKEMPGILMWAIEGYKRLYKNQCFTEYSKARDELYNFANESELVLKDFINTIRPGQYHPTELYDKYVTWSDDVQLSSNKFGRMMRNIGYQKKTLRDGDKTFKGYVV